MHCLKCGKEIMTEQVFCDGCLEGMDAYPVKPGTPLQLPNRPTAMEVKRSTPRKKVITPEEQLLRLQKVIKWLVLSVVFLALGLCLTVMLLLSRPADEPQLPATGQEYSAIDPTGSP